MHRLVALLMGISCSFTGVSFLGSTASAAEPAAVTLVALNGLGIKKTKTFRPSEQWKLNWMFECFARSDIFVVHMIRKSDERHVISIVNEAGPRGSGTATPHFAEPMYLEVVSPCHWVIRVVDPGAKATPRPR